jgi:AraC family transcriptional regulator
VKPETQSFYQLAVQQAVERVLGGLDEALDLERLARGAALSPFHFHRIFRGMLGETPLELHRRLRLERAALCLREQATPVITVALDAGYDTHEAFTRAFRAHYSCSPSEFRSDGQDRAGCVRPPQIEIAAHSGVHFEAQRSGVPVVHFSQQGDQSMNIEIKQMPALRVATVRHVGPYNRISEAFGRLGDIAGRAGLIHGKPTMLAVYHDDAEATPEPELRSDAAIVVADSVNIPEGMGEQRLPAGRYACALHVGPYEQLGDAWGRLMGHWLPQSGERCQDGDSYEIYVNNPLEAPKNELRTELYIPLV